MSHDAWKESAVGCSCCMRHGGSFDTISKCFLSLLVEPAMLVMRWAKNEEGEVEYKFRGLALKATTYGFVSQPVFLTESTFPGLRTVEWNTTGVRDGKPLQIMTVEDVKYPLK